MIRYLRLSTATSIPLGPLVRASDGYSLLATTIACRASDILMRKANSAVWTAMASAAVSMPIPGWISLPIPASDLNVVGPFHLALNATAVTSATIFPVWVDHYIINQNAYDALFAASGSYLPVNVLQITGSAPSAAAIGSVANLTTGVAVTSIAAGVGVNVSSVAAGVGVNVSSINAAVGVNVSSIATGVNVTSINGSAVSTVIPQYVLDYVMNVWGAQSLTVKDYLRAVGAVVGGKIVGVSTATGAHFLSPSGTVRVSAVMDADGNRTSVSWVTGP